jgi:hypothetical protein
LNRIARLFKQSPTVVATELDDEIVLLNLDTGVYYGLDTVGAEVWTLLSKELDFDSIIACLLEEYEVTDDQLRADVGELLEQLLEHQLVQAAPDRNT